MKNNISTAPRAVSYSARCCSDDACTAPRDAGIGDYSAPCGSEGRIPTPVTAPRADLKSFTRRSPFSGAPLHRSTAVASAVRCSRFQALRTTSGPLHRLHPSNMSQIAPFDLAGRALHTGDTTSRVTDRHGAHPLRPDHPVHDVHHLRPMQNHTTRNA